MKKNLSVARYIVMAIVGFVCAFIISSVIRILILFDLSFIPFSQDAALMVISLIDPLIAAIATSLVIYQLKAGENINEQEKNIGQAEFILQYNQSFIQDESMVEIENKLEMAYEDSYQGKIISESNRQNIINYLVYIEGLAPLIITGVLQLKYVDDLLAYRFFLAMNNKEIQDDQLKKYPDYYRGCFKLYKIWKEYRELKCYEIIGEKNALDSWEDFELYADDSIEVRTATKADSTKKISELFFDTDPYIYPAAFGNKTGAAKIISKLLENKAIKYRNIRLAVSKNEICGLAYIIKNDDKDVRLRMESMNLPSQFSKVWNQYFQKLYDYVKNDDTIYIVCLCVDSKHQRKGIGNRLVKSILNQYKGKKIVLHVLCDNETAIKLYKNCGFVIDGEATEGFALDAQPPKCFKMVRYASGKCIE